MMRLSYVESEFLMELIENFCWKNEYEPEEKDWVPNYAGEGLKYSQIENLWNRIQDEKFNRTASES
jgi:hypothetical protein